MVLERDAKGRIRIYSNVLASARGDYPTANKSQSGFRQAGSTPTDFARRILALYILIDPATLVRRPHK
jgi:hypothetical protein